MYLSTPHDGVLALDAATGKFFWRAAYNLSYVLLFAVNRGVGPTRASVKGRLE